MIKLCPYCGHSLSCPLDEGITTCDCCNLIFESSDFHRLLSAAWMVRNWHVYDADTLRHKFKFSDYIVDLVDRYIIQGDLTHDEFLKVAREETSLDLSA